MIMHVVELLAVALLITLQMYMHTLMFSVLSLSRLHVFVSKT